jgi:hypothetical protein
MDNIISKQEGQNRARKHEEQSDGEEWEDEDEGLLV